MNKKRTALALMALLLLGISSAATAGGYGKGHYGHTPVYYGGHYPHRHSGYRYGHRHQYRHGYRKGYRHGYRHSYRHGHRYRNAYRKGYRHGYRSRYRHGPRGYYYRPAPYYYPAGITLHFGF